MSGLYILLLLAVPCFLIGLRLFGKENPTGIPPHVPCIESRYGPGHLVHTFFHLLQLVKTYRLLKWIAPKARVDRIPRMGRFKKYPSIAQKIIRMHSRRRSYIGQKEIHGLLKNCRPDELLLTADTVVWHQGLHLAKPEDRQEAISMLGRLSGSIHEVIAGWPYAQRRSLSRSSQRPLGCTFALEG